MKRALLAFLAGVALLLLGVAVAGQWLAGRDGPTELPVYGEVPAFRLEDQYGASFGRDALAGRVWVAAFVFTRCRGQCPVMLSALRRAREAATGGEAPSVVAFSVDPEHDTAEVLRAFAREVAAADTAGWSFLTGERDSIYQLARRGLLLPVEAAGGDSLEPILHSSRIVLVDRGARIRGFYDGLDPAEIERLIADLRLLFAHRRT